MKKIISALSIASILILSGCATTDGGYTQSSVGQTKSVKRGTVLEVRNITIGDDYKGTATGAVVGGVAGSAFGKGDGKVAAAAAGALIGALAGGSLNKDAGQELVIKYDNGDVVTTVYKVDKNSPFMFRNGDRVIVEMLNAAIVSIRMAN